MGGTENFLITALLAAPAAGLALPHWVEKNYPVLGAETGNIVQAADIPRQVDQPVFAARSLDTALTIRRGTSDLLPADAVTRDGWHFWLLSVDDFKPLRMAEVYNEKGERIEVKESGFFGLTDPAESLHFPQFFGDRKAQPPTDPNQDLMDVVHTDLDLTIDLDSRFLSGVATITVESLDDGFDTVVFDLNDNGGAMNVNAVSSSGGPLPYSYTNDRIFITLPEALPAGDTTLVTIEYSGTPLNDSGDGYLRSIQNGVPLIYTNSQPYNARHWHPCKDVPNDKTTLDFSISFQDRSYAGHPVFAVSNGRLVSNSASNGQRTVRWQTDYPISTYLISLTVTNFRWASAVYTARDDSATMDVSHYVWPDSFASQAGEAVNTVTAIEIFAELFDEEYPYLDEKYWTATWGLGFGMEHQTATSMPDPSRTSDTLSTPFTRRNIHELAHQWFGDMITLENYDHLWVNEGWATYCEALFYEEQTRRSSGDAAASAVYHNYVDNWNLSDAEPIVSPNADSFNLSVTYRKAAFVLHMLRRVLGDEDFFQGMRDYLDDPSLRFGNADTDDVREAFENASGQDLRQFFDQWFYRASRPDYEWSYAQDGNRLLLLIVQTQTDDVFEMPIDFAIEYTNGQDEIITVVNSQREQSYSIDLPPGYTVQDFDFDPDNWLHDFNTEVSATAPAPPEFSSVIPNPITDEIEFIWEPIQALGLSGYRLYRLTPGEGSVLVADESVLTPDTGSYTITDAPHGVPLTYYLTSMGLSEGTQSTSFVTQVAAGRQALIVHGYDRWARQEQPGIPNPLPYYHGQSLAAAGVGFAMAANETIGDTVSLSDYAAVHYVLGNESTVDETFSDREQIIVSDFLEAGGSLFVSGNEIAWDLDWRGATSDRNFFNNYLRSQYLQDDSLIYTVQGLTDGIFTNAIYNYGGNSLTFRPEFPDVIGAVNSSDTLIYQGSTLLAGIQYEGPFAADAPDGRLVYIGFSVETMTTEEELDDFMQRIAEFLMPPSSVDQFILY